MSCPKDDPEQLTVQQLIELLQQMPKDALVVTEGCDCDGNAGAVELGKDGRVYIGRTSAG